MDWWSKFDLWEFIIHPGRYGVPLVDAWIREWGNWLDMFVQTNPWFFGFLTGTGLSWLTWVVMKTPWRWDNWLLEWFKVKVLKRPSEKVVVADRLKKEVIELTDVVEEEKK